MYPVKYFKEKDRFLRFRSFLFFTCICICKSEYLIDINGECTSKDVYWWCSKGVCDNCSTKRFVYIFISENICESFILVNHNQVMFLFVDIIQTIIMYLDPMEIFRIASVCSYFNENTKQSSFWKMMCTRYLSTEIVNVIWILF